ncbi:hypothetical protein ABEB36_008922 [Hypothenemus hampei]|uniref:Protein PTHB1 n=1 Tax=Hypothenemus hampei TaxID=57062 RepID=A0ABD1ENI8_HYPHA
MSLFKIRQFWSSTCEENENFDQNSLMVASVNSQFDYIITSSHNGVLRIFKPSCESNENGIFRGFQPNDSIIEKIFDTPILQTACGKLLSGSQETHLAVLHPRLLTVYSLICKTGKTDHGNEVDLQLLYEHKLHRSAANCVVGPFGGSKNRDFICVQSLDGLLSFFEHENQVFHFNLPDFLLPGPLCYLSRNDCFIHFGSDWIIRAYRYKALSEIRDENSDPIYSKPKIFSEWDYSLGESVMDIQIINDSDNNNKETWIVILGEKNLFSLSANGRLKFMIKLGFCPLCMDSYVIESNLFTLIISETNHLLVYENTTLKWSARLEFLPISIKRAFFEQVKGALVLLSDEGRLECSYLGTEPSLFVAPPMHVQEINFDDAEKQLLELEKIIASSNSNDSRVQKNIEEELEVIVNVSAEPEICTFQHNIKNATNNYMCKVDVKLIPKITFQEIQVSIAVQRPLKVVPNIHFFSNINVASNVSSYIFLDMAADVSSLKFEIIVSVINNFGVPCTKIKSGMLPLSLVLEKCHPEKDNKHKITLVFHDASITLALLFPEFSTEEQSIFNAIGLKSASGNVGTILLAKSSEKYRLQSDNFTMLSLITEQLIIRVKKHYPNVKISFNSSLPGNEILVFVQKHFKTQQKVKEFQNLLLLFSTQFRLIQKRLISKYRTKTPISLKFLELLLNDTYSDILDVTGKLEKELENLQKIQTDLSCCLHLLNELIQLLNINDDDILNMIKSVYSTEIIDLDSQAWEDIMDVSLCFLLRTVMAKTEKDKLRAPHTCFEEIKDISKLEKHFLQVLERIPKQNFLKEMENQLDEDEPASDKLHGTDSFEDEKNETKPIGSQYGEFSSRLLSARKSLMRRHKINDLQLNEDPKDE